MPKYASIDIGANAIKFYLAEKSECGDWKVILDKAEVTRLGEGLNQTNKISAIAMNRNMAVLGEMIDIARREGADEVLAVGTMVLRTASNARDFIRQVYKKFGLKIEVIPGEEEARLSFLAVTTNLNVSNDRFIIFDIGGGSTEFISGQNHHMEQRSSVNIGVVRLTEEILQSDPVTESEFNMSKKAIESAFQSVAIPNRLNKLIGVGATLTTLGAMKHEMGVYDPAIIHGSYLTLSDVEGLILLLKSRTIAERKRIVGLEPKRADVILAGAMMVQAVMKMTGMDLVMISDRGVRHGLLIDRFGIKYSK